MISFIKQCTFRLICMVTVMSLSIVTALAYEYETEHDIYMIGDIHGAFQEFKQILAHSGLVDDDDNWSGGKSHFVLTGDMMSRGPSSRKVMDFLIKLTSQAEQAGGKVHVLLGNHEVFSLVGDYRYTSAEEFAEFAKDETPELRQQYFARHSRKNIASVVNHSVALDDFDKQFPLGFFARRDAFRPEGKYGRWLQTLPFVIKINEHIFTHGGLSVKTLNYELDELNESLKEQLTNYTSAWNKLIEQDNLSGTLDYSLRPILVSQLRKTRTTRRFLKTTDSLLFSNNSPTWYRGNAMCHPLFENNILNQALSNFNASNLWVGHTAGQTVRQRFDNTILLMDTGMLKKVYNGQPIYAHIKEASNDPNMWSFINAANGETLTPKKVPVRRNINPHNMSDMEVEEFLKTATITSKEKLGEGITNPLKIVLEQNGKKVTAVFKYFDSGKLGRATKQTINDRFQYEIAAYKLDRIMGLGLVPAVAERRINGKRGVLQLWINDLINYKTMDEQKIKYEGFCNYQRQRQMMDVFDYLILNADRNLSNITYTLDDWQLWFIDHTRSFGNGVKRTKLLVKADLTLTPEFRKVLESLNKENLRVLEPAISSRQIRAILKRRDRLLNGKA